MQVVILAGGLGTRISEESILRPKPMIEIGGRPIIWHIMKTYAAHGFHDFIICCGYKGYLIKEYFANYFLHMADVTIDVENNAIEVHHKKTEPWRVTLVDTGEATMTGGRLKRVASYLTGDFCMTYGDGVGDIDVSALRAFHESHGRLATMTTVQPASRFGALELDHDSVKSFVEKPVSGKGWINGGFFILSPKILDYIAGDDVPWERAPLEQLAKEGQLKAYFHQGFWQPMDTLRDKNYLEGLWQNNEAPWKTWS